MRTITLLSAFLFGVISVSAQPIPGTAPENIYSIKKQFLESVVHNPVDKNETGDDNDLERFNRWFYLAEPRCYPSGNLPRPDVLIRAYDQIKPKSGATQRLTSVSGWQSLGPVNVPPGYNGIGRVNCVVLDPLDTNTLYVGTACGGVWVSHNGGATWTSNSDNFPSLSVADIAVNPRHTDTLYAATGDGNGDEYLAGGALHYEDIFWGGLYSAGVMKSTDGGSTWHTTGLSYLQSDRDIIQRLLIEPNNPNILIASSRNGTYRTTDAGATWTLVDSGHVYAMEFHPLQPDTIYAINNADLKVSYNAGQTWAVQCPALITVGYSAAIAVSAVSPKNIWLWSEGSLVVSHDEGHTFTFLTPPSPVSSNEFYGTVLGVSPADSQFLFASGLNMGMSPDGSTNWYVLDSLGIVHVDHHCVTFNPINPSTFYVGNDGGIFVTHDGGNSWTNISNGLVISQVYRMSSSRQNPYVMLAGLQDNETFYNDGTHWLTSNAPLGDGMACAIFSGDDHIQLASTQQGNIFISYDRGATFTRVTFGGGYWTAPLAFSPVSADTVYYGMPGIFASYTGGGSFINLTPSFPFHYGAISLAVAPAFPNVIYAADYETILRTFDGGATWSDVTGNLVPDSLAITHIAIDYKNPLLVYVTTSGYKTGKKVFVSTTGGTNWNNISYNMPNLPANVVAADSSTPGALFVGTDIGVYYTDSAHAGTWSIYNTGLPNVMVDDIDINYTNYKVRAATYGRGIWECDLVHPLPKPVGVANISIPRVQLYPNPTAHSWKLTFANDKPNDYNILVSDATGKVVHTQRNQDVINAENLPPGVYDIEVLSGTTHLALKAIRE